MADTNKGLAERVEVFTRATSDALQKAVGEVLDARNPWQLLYRLSRIVLLGLVLYTAWLLITLQPELAKRMSTTSATSLQQQVAARQPRIQELLRTAIESSGSGLHTLALLQWSGGSSVTVLAADGRSSQLGMAPGQQPLLGVDMAEALGHVALGLCASEAPAALPITVRTPSGSEGVMLLCPVGCSGRSSSRALLLGLHDPPSASQKPSNPGQQPSGQQAQLLLIAQRLGELLSNP